MGVACGLFCSFFGVLGFQFLREAKKEAKTEDMYREVGYIQVKFVLTLNHVV